MFDEVYYSLIDRVLQDKQDLDARVKIQQAERPEEWVELHIIPTVPKIILNA